MLKKLFTIKLRLTISFLCCGNILFAQSVWTVFNTDNSPLLDNIITVVEEADDNAIWIGTSWGLFRYDAGNWTDYTDDIIHPYVRSISFDSNNGVWVGTLSGASYFNGIEWTSWNSVNSPLNTAVNAIEYVDDSTLWAGTVNGLFLFTDSIWSLYLDTSSLEPFINVSSLTQEGDSLCVGTINGGFGYLYNDTISWHNIHSGMLDNTMVDIVVDQNNNNWLASPSGGLQRQLNDDSWYFYHPEFYNDWPSPDILSLFLNDENNLLLGTNELGFFELNTSDNSIPYLLTTENSGLTNNKVNDLLIDVNGLYWIATEDGLNTWNGDLSTAINDLYPVATFNTLVNDYINFSKVMTINLYSIGGRLILGNKKTKQLNLSGFSSGVYLLETDNQFYKILKY